MTHYDAANARHWAQESMGQLPIQPDGPTSLVTAPIKRKHFASVKQQNILILPTAGKQTVSLQP